MSDVYLVGQDPGGQGTQHHADITCTLLFAVYLEMSFKLKVTDQKNL